MGLSIGGLFFGALSALYVLIAFADFYIASGAVALGIFGLPLSIVGRILAGKSIEEGNYSTPTNLGQKMGLAGIITSAVGLGLGFILLLAA